MRMTRGSGAADAELVDGARRGDGPAREELVRRYLRRAFGVALAVLHDVADAEDVAQEAVWTALSRLHECRIPSRFGAWLLRGAHNRALNQLAQRTCRALLLGELQGDGADGMIESALPLGKSILDALEELPPIRRAIVLLHDIEEWTHAEIAAALQISVVTSRQHLFQARRALRDLIGDGEPSPVPAT